MRDEMRSVLYVSTPHDAGQPVRHRVPPADGDFVLVVPASVAKHHRRDIAIVAAAVVLANSVLAQARASQAGTTLAALTRHGGFSTHWWGVSMWLDSYATNKLLNPFCGLVPA